jgi:heme exporter protein D
VDYILKITYRLSRFCPHPLLSQGASVRQYMAQRSHLLSFPDFPISGRYAFLVVIASGRSGISVVLGILRSFWSLQTEENLKIESAKKKSLFLILLF